MLPKRRYFYKVSVDELKRALEEMVDKLGISGSGYGYSLYEAVENERQKAINAQKENDKRLAAEFPKED